MSITMLSGGKNQVASQNVEFNPIYVKIIFVVCWHMCVHKCIEKGLKWNANLFTVLTPEEGSSIGVGKEEWRNLRTDDH